MNAIERTVQERPDVNKLAWRVNATRVATDEELMVDGTHTAEFLQSMKDRTAAVLRLVKKSGNPNELMPGRWSAGWTQDTEQAARTGVASFIDCAKEVYTGKYANGFVFARPPSHHAVGNAERARNGAPENQPYGFCHLNAIAAGGANLRQVDPGVKICILDFDVHPGNGNEDTFWNDPSVFTVSIHEDGIWPNDSGGWKSGDHVCHPTYVGGPNALGTVLNFPVESGATDAEYYYVMVNYIIPKIQDFKPDIIFVAAGFDALKGDKYADQKLTPDWYGWCISELMRLKIAPLVLNLEGGYNPENVAKAANKCIDALAGQTPDSFIEAMGIKVNGGDVDGLRQGFVKCCREIDNVRNARLETGPEEKESS